jgi:hypothetical protein
VAAAAVLIGLAPAARAQDAFRPSRPDDGWKYDIGFYFWITDMEGEIENRGIEVEVDADYGDVFDKLESTFGLRFEAWQRDQFGACFDICWISLEDEPEFASGEGKAEVNFGFTELAVAGRTRTGQGYFDLFGGVRWVRLESGLEDPAGGDEEDAKNYFDPIIGVRFGIAATEWLNASLRFDIGGFGVGTERTGNLVLMADFNVGQGSYLSAGWRTMATEIEEDRQGLDLVLSGPVLAVKIGF